MSYTKKVKELTCSWEGCSEVVDISSNKFAFVKHVSFHIPHVKIVKSADGYESYECLWTACHYRCDNDMQISRHIKYHAYHSRLKALGTAFIKEKCIPPCRISSFSSLLPDEELKCMWRKCYRVFICQETFNNHVVEVHARQAKANSNGMYTCLWGDCNVNFSRKPKLEAHTRMHTGAKAIACPNCGQSFVDSSKFKGHCYRQAPVKDKGFKCSYCLKILPTESLLKDHMRVHVQHYKCPLCDLTCRAPSSLITHLRYRHIKSRTFKCPICSYTCQKNNDLRIHLVTHKVKNLACPHKGCKYVTARPLCLEMHVASKHGPEKEAKYACHLCDLKFIAGKVLSKHLTGVHEVEKPFGFYRFIYKLEEDGFRRLQTTRLENIYMDDEDEEDEDDFFDHASSIDYDYSDSEVIEVRDGNISIEVVDNSGRLLGRNMVSQKEELPKGAQIVAVIGENVDSAED